MLPAIALYVLAELGAITLDLASLSVAAGILAVVDAALGAGDPRHVPPRGDPHPLVLTGSPVR